MTYRVFWAPYAENRLGQIVQSASDTAAVAAAAREIDRHLAANPNAFGESRYDTVRVGFARPLGVQFEVMGDVRTVIVYDAWRIDRK
jgi:plasmid stabilization system protein ParE